MKTDNELIAEFMGLTLQKEIDGIKYYNIPVGHIESYNASQGDFKYHKRWDWLMPVVEKIGTMNAEIKLSTTPPRCLISFLENADDDHWCGRIYTHTDHSKEKFSLIQCVYKSIVDFIRWHNSNAQPETV